MPVDEELPVIVIDLSGTWSTPNPLGVNGLVAIGEEEARDRIRYGIPNVKSYGRAHTFLMTTGFEQARSVVAALAGDIESADRVELVLPETGVCGSNLGDDAGSCCGGEAPARVATDEPAHVESSQGRGIGERGKPVKIPVTSRACCG